MSYSNRYSRRRSATLVAGVLCLAASAQAHAAELPQRRPGLWRISTISPEVGLQTHEVCIDVGDGILGARGANCAKPNVESADGEFVVTFSCNLRDGAREVTSLLFSGDFTSWYRAQSKMTFTEANGKARPGTGFTIDAKFLSPECPKSAAQ